MGIVNKRYEMPRAPLGVGHWGPNWLMDRDKELDRSQLVHRLAYNGDVVAFKMGRRQGARFQPLPSADF